MASSTFGPDHRRRDLLIGLRAPGLALLAAASVLSGYKWLGLIPTEHPTSSFHAFSRPGAAIFAVMVIPLAALLTGPVTGPGDSRRRSMARWSVLAAAGSVVIATVALLATHTPATHRLLGVVDLVLAVACVAALVAGERSVRPAAGRRPTAGWAAHTLPFRSPN
jgi:cytochrome bd-type quinol oxidase subunit 2